MITIILFIIGLFFYLFVPPEMSAFYFAPPVDLLWVFRIFTHMLSHANLQHLLGNFIFGMPYLLYAEHKLKSHKKFLSIYVLCGVVALLGQFLFEYYVGWDSGGGIGSSGAIFGVIAFALASANEAWWIRVPAHFILGMHIINQGSAVYAVAHGEWSFVAYAAHFAGILCGIACYHVPRISSYWSGLKSLLRRLDPRSQKSKSRAKSRLGKS